MKKRLFIFLLGLFYLPNFVLAHQPIIEQVDQRTNDQGFYGRAVILSDPLSASQAVYGRIEAPSILDVYAFVPKQDGEIPVELLVPVRRGNKLFKPSILIISPAIPEKAQVEIDLDIPENYGSRLINSPENRNSNIFFEPFSFERLYHGEKINLQVKKDTNYFVIIFDPAKQVGDYVLGVGSVENFNNTSKLDLVSGIVALKLGLIGDFGVPWMDIVGLFILLAGFIIGLGSVTVIDWHGFLARRSGYWTEATIRTHKITKPLIWLGITLVIIGSSVLYRDSWFTGTVLLQAILFLFLILNGLYLSLVISPRLLDQEKEGRSRELLPKDLQSKIILSFIISFLGWWSCLFLTAWQILLLF